MDIQCECIHEMQVQQFANQPGKVIFDTTPFVSPLTHKCTFVTQLFCLLRSNVYGLLRIITLVIIRTKGKTFTDVKGW